MDRGGIYPSSFGGGVMDPLAGGTPSLGLGSPLHHQHHLPHRQPIRPLPSVPPTSTAVDSLARLRDLSTGEGGAVGGLGIGSSASTMPTTVNNTSRVSSSFALTPTSVPASDQLQMPSKPKPFPSSMYSFSGTYTAIFIP